MEFEVPQTTSLSDFGGMECGRNCLDSLSDSKRGRIADLIVNLNVHGATTC